MSATYFAWAIGMSVIGLLLSARGGAALRLCIVLFITIPFSTLPGLLDVDSTGGQTAVHPIVWIILVQGAVSLWRDGLPTRRFIRRNRFGIAAGLVLLIDGGFWTIRALGHVPGAQYIDQVAASFALFLWARHRIDAHPRERVDLARFLVGVGVAQAVLSVGLTLVGVQSLWGLNSGIRQAGTMDGPLPLALLLATCVPLTVAVRSSAARLLAMLLLAGAMLTTQSRTGLILVAAGIAYVLVADRSSVVLRAIVIIVSPVLVLVGANSVFAQGVTSRFLDDQGSADLRSVAADYFWSNPTDWVWQGHGVGASYTIAADAGLQSSFESAFFMYSIDFGMVATVIAFGLLGMQVLLRPPWRRKTTIGGVAALIVCALFVQGYSSIATESAAGPLLWLVVALAAGAPTPAAVAPVGGTEKERHTTDIRARRSPRGVPL